MARDPKPSVKGYETNTITTFRSFKALMIDLLRGYPEYEYFGKFESIFSRNGKRVVEILSNDKLIELSPQKKEDPVRYRRTPSGINLAISMINLEHSEKMVKYGRDMRTLTITTIILGMSALLLSMGTFCFQFNLIP